MNFLALLDWRLWAAVLMAIAAAAGGWKCYTLGERHVQAEFDAYVAKQVEEELAAERAVRDREHDLQNRNQTVSTQYATLKTATGTAVLALDADRVSLMADAAAARRAASDTEASARAYAAIQEDVLDGCTRRYVAVAGEAQAESNKVTGLQSYINDVVFAPQKQ